MLTLDFHPAGRHFLQIPGPSPVPDRILRAMSYPTIDHRGPEFGALGLKVLAGIKKVFKTEQPVIIYPASGTGVAPPMGTAGSRHSPRSVAYERRPRDGNPSAPRCGPWHCRFSNHRLVQ